ncbi:MAG: hypothetical protein RBG13Loki_4084, partial [Promethearchaeota archaeon CR_4]
GRVKKEKQAKRPHFLFGSHVLWLTMEKRQELPLSRNFGFGFVRRVWRFLGSVFYFFMMVILFAVVIVIVVMVASPP